MVSGGMAFLPRVYTRFLAVNIAWTFVAMRKRQMNTSVPFGTAKTRTAVLALALAACVTAPSLLAQMFYGGLRGLVHDADGAVIVGAEVSLASDDTGATRSTVSNEVGEFSFPNIEPGNYTLRAELLGFAPYVRNGLAIGISDALVLDVTLNVGDVEETVTVTAAAPLIEKGSASLASTIDRSQLEVLPTPGRNVFIMAVTTPNVVHTGNPVWVKQSDQTNSSLLSLGGGPLRGNNYTIDGVSTTDMRNRSVIIPVFEAVQEMKVQTNTYDAEMGRTGGGVFNTIHRSGTNNWAGSALYQFRPGKLNTFLRKLPYFQQKAFDEGALRQEDLNSAPYNVFGGSFGGPIKRDRTFFWLATEGFSDNTFSDSTVVVPTPGEASADFSESAATVYDPYDRDANGHRRPFPNNRIPNQRIDPTGSALTQLLGSLGPGGQLSASGSQRVRAVQTTGNVKHAVTDAWRVSGTYLYYTSQEPVFGHYQNLLNADTRPVFGPGSSTLGRNVHALALNNTFIPTPTSVLTLRYGQTYFNDSWGNLSYGKEDLRNQLGIQGSFLDQIYGQEGYEGQFPLINVADFGEGGHTHGSESIDDVQWSSREVSGTYSRYFGNHTLKFGGQWRRLALHTVDFGNGFTLDFAKKFTQGPDPTDPDTGSGSGLADLLLGIPDGGAATLATPADLYLDYFGAFIHDDWRLAPNLVLNLGLRLEHETGLKEDGDDFVVGWDRDREFPVQPDPGSQLEGHLPGFPLTGGLMYAGVDGNPTHQWNPPAAKFGPRLGFAYSFGADTVLRGGYAVYWAPYAIPSSASASHVGTYGYTAVTNVATSVDGVTPSSAKASNPFPDGILEPAGNSAGRFQNIGADVYFNEQYRDSPYIQKWSADLQREIGRGVAVKVGYVGSRGSDLPVGGTLDSAININQLPDQFLAYGSQLNQHYPNPFYGDARFGSFSGERTLPFGQLLRPFPHFRNVYARHASVGRSSYNALRVELDKRFSGRWGARLNYGFTSHRDNIYEANTLLESETATVYNTPDGCAYQQCEVLEGDYSFSRLHIPHQANLNFMYHLGGKHKVLGGWTASLSTILRSGFPLVVTQNENPLGAYGFSYQRPESGVIEGGGNPEGRADRYLTAGTLEPTHGLTLSTASHTTAAVRSPALLNWDVAFEKSMSLAESVNLQLRFEFVNFFNGVNWRGPLTVFGSSNFGRIPGTRGFPRTFQMLSKITF